MKLKINRLRIEILTEDGDYGTDIPFDSGLNVLRAENSSGKSTSIGSIIFALGLEGMLSSKHDVPLPYVMKDKLEYKKDVYTTVLKSSVYLEIENKKNEIITLKRDVKGGKDIHIITMYEGPFKKDLYNQSSKDYFVRQPGSAQRERGFHKRLVEFLGWELPGVTKYNGTLSTLYVECIFPLMIVEQKRGWASIQSNTPKQFSIKEVEKRAIEFILNLDSYALTLKREKIISDLNELKSEWKTKTKEADNLSKRIKGKIVNLPSNIDNKVKLENVDIVVYKDDEIVPLVQVLKAEIKELKKINEIDLQTVKENRDELILNLNINEKEYYKYEQLSQETIQQYEFEQSYLDSINNRINATIIDLRKYKDIEKIQKLGSMNQMEFIKGTCPTCHQDVDDTLLPQYKNNNPMSIEENIKFLEEQKKTFDFAKINSQRKLEEIKLKIQNIRENLEIVRGRIRGIKSSLLAPDSHLNEDVIRERVVLNERIKFRQEILNEHELLMGNFEYMLDEFIQKNNELKSIPNDLLSREDKKKLRSLENLFREHVKDYRLSSIDSTSLYLSFDTYKPMHDGFDLESNLSASDVIRTIWAYLISLIELEGTNHLKLLILDEPKQHSADKVSFNRLLESYSKVNNAQIIFATSEPEKDIKPIIENIKCNFINESERKMFRKLH